MSPEEAKGLMESSNSASEWNTNADKVKSHFGGDYPGWWFETIIQSGVLRRTSAKWGGTDELQVETINLKDLL